MYQIDERIPLSSPPPPAPPPPARVKRPKKAKTNTEIAVWAIGLGAAYGLFRGVEWQAVLLLAVLALLVVFILRNIIEIVIFVWRATTLLLLLFFIVRVVKFMWMM